MLDLLHTHRLAPRRASRSISSASALSLASLISARVLSLARLGFACGLSLALCSAAGAASPLDMLSSRDATAGLREALSKGAEAAVSQLGTPGGFLNSDRFRIPLPPALDKASQGLRMLGMGGEADQLTTAMNKAAEAAVPEARTLLVEAVKKMSVQDAKAILTGPNDAATQYFRTATQAKLTERFLPIVHQSTEKLGLAVAYDKYAGQAAQLGLLKPEDAKLDPYVTGKALDALFVLIAEQEKAIRADPVGQGSSLLSKVFGAALH